MESTPFAKNQKAEPYLEEDEPRQSRGRASASLDKRLKEEEKKLLQLTMDQTDLLVDEKTENSKLAAIEAKIARQKKLVASLQESIELKRRIAGIAKDLDETTKTEGEGARLVVPTNLPRFRQGRQAEDPSEFLENFQKVITAHGITGTGYVRLMPLCLDSVDSDWMHIWTEQNKPAPAWWKFERDFLQHFQHPNTHMLWQEQIRKLRMTSEGVQRYTDQFVRLATKLNWSLDNNNTIYQYKQGLSNWMNESLTAAEAAALSVGVDMPGVELLGKMALRIEVNRRDKQPQMPQTPRYNNYKKTTPVTCRYCSKVDHIEEDCRIKQRNEKPATAAPAKEEVPSTPKQQNEKNPPGAPQKPVRCYACGQMGHYSSKCPNRQDVRVVEVDQQQKIQYEDGKIEVPCTVNGHRLIALLDTGANRTVVDQLLAEEQGWKIAPRKGTITQAEAEQKVKRIGVIEDTTIKVGGKSWTGPVEVMQLSGDVQLLIEMDTFSTLGFQLNNVPITWPEEVMEMEEKKRKKDLVEQELPSNVDENGIATEWKKVLKDNLRLPISSVCKLPDSVLAINTEDAKPVYIRQYPIPQALVERVVERVETWEKNGWIERAPPNCQWNSPLLAAAKPAKEKEQPDDIRLCLDARYLNEKIVEMPDSNLPLLRDVLDTLGNFNWISTVDLADSYHQFQLREEDRPKTAFTINGKQYMFRVVPFGLKIMTGHMQRIMEKLLLDLRVVPFQDDVAITSKDTAEHIKRVKQVLERITYDAGLRIRLKKCKFFKTEARVLGTMVARSGLKMDPEKIEAITNWPRPTNGKEMQRFMGAANFHREFSHEFAKIAAPLDACRNKKHIEWTEERIKAFEDLKDLFRKNIQLQHVDWTKKMYLTTDASQDGIGAWIGQISQDRDLLPIVCVSKKFNTTQQKWPATKKELYALMWGMKRLRHYLLGRNFIARVDHKPLIALLRNKSTMLTERWMDTIMEFSFMTEYLPGEKNTFADALSRSHEGKVRVTEVEEDAEDLASRKFEAEMRGLKLPASKKEQQEMLEKQHAIGHFGTKKMVKKINKDGYWWPRMWNDAKHLVKTCVPCQRYNLEKEGYHPAKAVTAKEQWDHIQVDLIGPLQTSENGHNFIVTIVDVCTGFTLVQAIKNKEMETVARCLWTEFANFGTPQILQSDNGLEFANQTVRALTVMYGIEHRLITAYHSSANKLVERTNKEVSKALKKFSEGTYTAWNEWMPMVQISLNKMISKRTGSAAFSLMFGRQFNGFRDFRKVESCQDWNRAFREVKDSWEEFKKLVLPALEKRVSQVKMDQAMRLNQRKQVDALKPGDTVMLKDPIRASKWDPVYEGPYTVIKQHEGGAYSLKDALGRTLPRRCTVDMMKSIPIEENRSKSYSVEEVLAHELEETRGTITWSSGRTIRTPKTHGYQPLTLIV